MTTGGCLRQSNRSQRILNRANHMHHGPLLKVPKNLNRAEFALGGLHFHACPGPSKAHEQIWHAAMPRCAGYLGDAAADPTQSCADGLRGTVGLIHPSSPVPAC